MALKSKKANLSKPDPRKHPKPGYDEKQPNKQFPVRSGTKIKKRKTS